MDIIAKEFIEFDDMVNSYLKEQSNKTSEKISLGKKMFDMQQGYSLKESSNKYKTTNNRMVIHRINYAKDHRKEALSIA